MDTQNTQPSNLLQQSNTSPPPAIYLSTIVNVVRKRISMAVPMGGILPNACTY